ncbi:hypothetical protein ACI68E_001805 [Malassezia pachydermatis]
MSGIDPGPLLEAVLTSIDEVSAAYMAWNAASPGWDAGPDLEWREGALVATQAAVARTQVPVVAELWPERTGQPLPGLAAFRQAVQAEYEYVTGTGTIDTSTSNASYLVAFWSEVLHALCSYGPVTTLNVTRAASKPKGKRKSYDAGPTTSPIHIVGRQGTHWIRLLPIRLDALLREWQEMDHVLANNIEADENSAVPPTSIVQAAREMLAARTTESVELVLTRLSPADVEPSSGEVAQRLNDTVRAVEAMGVHVRMGASKAVPLHIQLPRPPPPQVWHPTRTINVDVSAMIALCSDLSHGYTRGLEIHANRALSLQAQHENDMPLWQHLLDYASGPLHLVATPDTLAKFTSIVDAVASPREKERALWLCGHRQGLRPWGPFQREWEECLPLPVRTLSIETLPVIPEEQVQSQAYADALATLKGRTRAKSLGTSPHTWQALQYGLALGYTTLLAHANGIEELLQTAGPLLSALDASPHALFWVIQPRSFVTHMTQAASMPSMRSDSASSTSNLLASSDAVSPLRPSMLMSHARTTPVQRMQRWSVTAWKWLQGPEVVSNQPLRHYPWWPWATLEAKWCQWTEPIAWTPPPKLSDPFVSDSNERMELSTWNAHSPSVLLPSSSKRSSFTPTHVRPFSYTSSATPSKHWWDAIKRDVLRNKWHWIVLAAVCIGWLFGFAVIVHETWFEASVLTPTGWVKPTPLDCTATFWGRNAQCGLDGSACRPFSDASMPFRCPSGCSGVTLLNERIVGDTSYIYQPLVVGGGNGTPYRADSFVCSAAKHAGLIQRHGGCGILRMVGTFSRYQSNEQNGIKSAPFSSAFPSSFVLQAPQDQSHCTDYRWRLYVLDVVFSVFVTLVLRPMPAVLFWILSCMGFWHVNLASELRDMPPPIGDAVGDFGPFLFVCFVIWYAGLRHVWPAFRPLPLEFGIGWLGLWWIGVLLDVVFADVPLSRLTGHDIAQQPGALTSLVIIVVVVICLAINQVRVIRNAGVLPKFLTLYIIAAIILGLCAAVPNEVVRLHHYIIALALLPGCCFPTRVSMLCCAILVGMFINGVGRWGFDGLLQDDAVVQGDATGSSALPEFSASQDQPGVIQWMPIPSHLTDTWTGFSLLVDDVVRHVGPGTSYNLTSLLDTFMTDTSERLPATDIRSTIENSVHYIRLAYASMTGTGDFTMPALAWLNGTFVPPPPGRS